ncbi:hypothetical protein P154DRAFT_580739 [Amniculicola lignicola CBS 123094]|uniref:Uncharacterized protein n=1 Tax=Amniculicola lignicola CBS 123094 TaxID=1392246 RepID=A0A6A5W3P4_9PLEO|nr:hypothetical protein P154DRAFT_580739 [Amniculicola lignicola CBS 123094]
MGVDKVREKQNESRDRQREIQAGVWPLSHGRHDVLCDDTGGSCIVSHLQYFRLTTPALCFLFPALLTTTNSLLRKPGGGIARQPEDGHRPRRLHLVSRRIIVDGGEKRSYSLAVAVAPGVRWCCGTNVWASRAWDIRRCCVVCTPEEQSTLVFRGHPSNMPLPP